MTDFEVVLSSIKRCVKDNLVDSDMKCFGEAPLKSDWLRRLRLALQLSSREVAGRLGVARQSYCKTEHSERLGSISLSKLDQAARALGYELVYGFRPLKNDKPPLEKIATEILKDVRGHGYLRSAEAKGVFRERRLAWLAATRFCSSEYRKSKGWANNPAGRIPYDRLGRRYWLWPDRYKWAVSEQLCSFEVSSS